MALPVLGLASLRRKLRALPDAAQALIAKAMEEGAEEIVAMARHLVPKDDGDLRDSIGWCWGDPPKGARIIARSRKVKDQRDMRISIFAGNDKAFYARWVEFGTQAHSLAKGADISSKSLRKRKLQRTGIQHPGSKAQPFFFFSFRANRKKVKSRISRAITKAAKQVAKT